MSKLPLILAVLALALAGVALLHRPAAAGGESTALDGGALSEADVRRLREEFERSVRARDDAVFREIGVRLQQLSDLRTGWMQAFQQAQRTAEGLGRENAGKLEELDDTARTLRGELAQQVQAVAALDAKWKEALDGAVAMLTKELARRPAGGGGPAPGPAKPTPAVEEPPAQPAEDPAVVKAAVEKALADLDQGDEETIYTAIVAVQRHKVMAAVPRLLKVLAPTSKLEYFTRQAAAAALGELRACDAIPALADALTDKSELVAQQANKAIRLITDFDTQMDPRARILERRRVRDAVMEWWGRHEQEVRIRHNQPKGGG